MKNDLTIRESIHGNFFYHLAKDGKALCGEKITMVTSLPLRYWGVTTHLQERYCTECEDAYDGEIFEMPDLDKLTAKWEAEHPEESKRLAAQARIDPIGSIKDFFNKHFLIRRTIMKRKSQDVGKMQGL